MTKISILTASLGSVLCMVTLFVAVAIAAGPPPAVDAHGQHATQGVCFLHSLVP